MMSLLPEGASPLLVLMAEAARTGATELNTRYGKLDRSSVESKGPADFASDADLAAENAIAQVLKRGAPEFGFEGEETGTTGAAHGQLRWIVDPLDGTTNYIWSVPYFSVSIALAEGSRVLAGIVLDPLREEMFCAETGKGAWLNGTRLEVSDRQPGQALISVSLPVPGQLKGIDEDRYLAGVRAAMHHSAGIRRLGSAALDLAYVAAGRLDGYIEDGLSYYDFAAGKLLVQEAGGRISDFAGHDPVAGSVVAGNPALHAWLRSSFIA
ncbi:inositol monophosphatase family protein [Microvirga yunnanensis]|uniref:inositol monophosphatase family protein n=1 Tax=Microvirga yunnanensis TaxID=2953740 RepID=UPI0021C606B5|nr:inositol monophosphatase family protein [Microvirga sp. HBU65207]